MRPFLPALLILGLLATAGAGEKPPKKTPPAKANRVDFGFFGPKALNSRHNPLLYAATFMKDGKMIFGRILESRPGSAAPSSKPKPNEEKKAPPAKAKSYVVVCIERNGVKTYPVVDQDKVQDRVVQNKDAKVSTAAGPFAERTLAEKRSLEILREERAQAEQPKPKPEEKP